MSGLVVGPPATGERFFDREEIVKLIWERLDTSSLLLVAPRRFGKTSIMLDLLNNPKDDYRTIFMDVEWFESPAQFVTEIIAEMVRCLPVYGRVLEGIVGLPKNILKFLKGTISDLELFEFKIGLRESIEKNWQTLGKILLKHIEKVDGKVILMLDEFPLMVKRMLKGKEKESVETFLHWFRSFRIGQDALNNVRFIIGGSIGIEHVLDQAGAVASMNDLDRIKVEPFPKDVAKNFIVGLFKSQNTETNDDTVEQILKEVEIFVPFFLQLLVSETCKLARDKKEDISPSLVSEAYRDRVISVESRTYFEHFYSRLRDYYDPDEERVTKEMLKQLALKKSLTIRELRNISRQIAPDLSDDVFSHILSDLENDFYLKRQDDSYIFHTKVLRDWWIRFYGF
jgi:uncharacterized protein